MADERAGTVAYVLKGYPRVSEIFIASEILRVEQAGVPLRLLVLKAPDEDVQHEVVRRIRAVPEYVTVAEPTSGVWLVPYLLRNLPRFVPALARVGRRRPRGLARSVGAAFAQAWRSRPNRWSSPRKVFLKDWLHGVAVADIVLADSDLVHLHAHFAHGATTAVWIASMITGVPFSFTGHAKDIYATKLNPAGLLRRKLLAAEFAVTCTEANRVHLDTVAPGAVVRRIYHGLNADFTALLAATDPTPRAFGSELLRMLTVGRLVPKKGIDLVVEALAIVRGKGIDAELVVAGERGSEGERIHARVAELELTDCVQFLGPQTQLELFDLYRAAGVFCLPCRIVDDGDRDGIPNVLVEAMATGLPVVSTPVSGIPELVTDGENGLLVAPEDAIALAEALVALHNDPGLAAAIGERGREDVLRRFDGDALVGELVERFGRPQ